MTKRELRESYEAKIKAVMYGLIVDSFAMDEPELERRNREMRKLLDTQKDD